MSENSRNDKFLLFLFFLHDMEKYYPILPQRSGMVVVTCILETLPETLPLEESSGIFEISNFSSFDYVKFTPEHENTQIFRLIPYFLLFV